MYAQARAVRAIMVTVGFTQPEDVKLEPSVTNTFEPLTAQVIVGMDQFK